MSKPSDQLIEEVAKALWESVNVYHGWSLPWAEMHGSDHALYRNQARAVLRSPSIQALVEALRAAEWGGFDTGSDNSHCPVCTNSDWRGHFEDCRLAAALEPFEAVPEEAAK